MQPTLPGTMRGLLVACCLQVGAIQVNADPIELDPLFGVNGRAEIIFPGAPSHDGVTRTRGSAQMTDGRLVLFGHAANQMALVRLQPNGSLDPSFGDAGRLVIKAVPPGTDVLVQPDGKILVSGNASGGFVKRLLPDGSLDTSFAGDGTFGLPDSGDPFHVFPAPRRLALLTDGRIMIAAETRVNLAIDWMLLRLLPNGTPDPSWGTEGVRTLDVQGNRTDLAGGLAVLPDGRVLVGGAARSSDETSADVAVMRFLSSGVIDTSFGTNGRFVFSLGDRLETLNDLVVQSDGRVVLLTSNLTIPRWQHSLLRLTPQGTLDESFDGDGRVDFSLAGSSESAAVLEVDSSQRIVVVGSDKDEENFNAREDIAVVRVTPSGVLDATFDGDGMAVFDLSGVEDYGTGLALQEDGDLIVTGQYGSQNSPGDFVALRLDPSGKLKTSYDEDGIAKLDLEALQQLSEARAMAIQADGRIVLAGKAQGLDGSVYGLGLTRLLPNGTLDPDYGAAGTASLPQLAAADCMALLPDGKALVGAEYPPVFARLDSTGRLDPSFGTGGILKLKFPTFDWTLFCIHVLDDGRILAAGSGGIGFLVLRLLPNGAVDPTFGTGGRTLTQITSSNSVAQAITIQDGNIVLAGYIRTGAAVVALARYTFDGVLDSNFSGDGIEITTLAGGHGFEPRGVVELPDGKLAVAGSFYHGSSQSDAVVLRYDPNGGLDTSFGVGGVSLINSYLDNEEGLAMALDPSGDVLVAGPMSSLDRNAWLLARVGSSGLLSAPLSLRYAPARPKITVQQTARGGQAIAVDGSGNVVMAGCNEQNMVAMRYKAGTGSLFHSYAEWAAHHFTAAEVLEPALAGPTADFDSDGFANAVEHVLDSSPRIPGNPLACEMTTTTYPALREVRVSLTYPASLPKNARLLIEGSGTSDSLNWTTLQTRKSEGFWAPGFVIEELLNDGRRRGHATFNFPTTSRKTFFRLKVLAP